MIIIGVDPGLSGAIAFLRVSAGSAQSLVVYDMPVLAITRGTAKKRELVPSELARIVDAEIDGNEARAFIEKVGAMPGQGVTSMFAFGKSYGIVIGVLALVSRTDVPPQTWKKALGVTKDKDGARHRASQIFPAYSSLFSRVKDDGRAEAALIAEYGYRALNHVELAA